MPAIHSMTDDVTTAGAVFDRAALVRENRRRSWARPKPIPLPPVVLAQPEPEPEPQPIEEQPAAPEPPPLSNPSQYVHQVRVIQRVVGHKYGVTIDDLMRDIRLKGYVIPRFITFYLARELTDHNGWNALGSRFSRDHVSVLLGVRRIKAKMADDPTLLAEVEELKRQCQDHLAIWRAARQPAAIPEEAIV